MADISDVTAVLASAVEGLIYPDGTAAPSAIGVPCQIMEGWPLPATLEKMAAKTGQTQTDPFALISIYPVPSSTGDGGSPLEFDGFVVEEKPKGIVAAVDGGTITFTGLATGYEFCTVLIDGVDPYTYQPQPDDTPEIIAAALAQAINTDVPGSCTVAGPTLSLPGSHTLSAKVGGTALVGRKISRQKTQIRIIVWSSNVEDRKAVAAGLDVFVKDTLRFRMPDTTDAILTYVGTNLTDNFERDGIYRRDLIYTALFDTIATAEAHEITNVSVRFTPATAAP